MVSPHVGTKGSLIDIARLYARRWDIEMAFKLAKRDLRLHLLWSGVNSDQEVVHPHFVWRQLRLYHNCYPLV